MAPAPVCTALAAAKERKGLSYSEIASALGRDEQHVIDGMCLRLTPLLFPDYPNTSCKFHYLQLICFHIPFFASTK